jgi:hypothetical protein
MCTPWASTGQELTSDWHPVRLAYQPPVSSIFLSQQTSHQQPASSTLLSEWTSTSHQPPANRTGCEMKLNIAANYCMSLLRLTSFRHLSALSCTFLQRPRASRAGRGLVAAPVADVRRWGSWQQAMTWGSIQRLRGWLLFYLVGSGLLWAGARKATGGRISSPPTSLRFKVSRSLWRVIWRGRKRFRARFGWESTGFRTAGFIPFTWLLSHPRDVVVTTL